MKNRRPPFDAMDIRIPLTDELTENIRATARTAQKFCFDIEASTFAGGFMKQNLRRVLLDMEHAQMPFEDESVMIEANYHAFITSCGLPLTNAEICEAKTSWCRFLFIGPTPNMFMLFYYDTAHERKHNPVLCPVVFQYKDQPEAEPLNLDGIDAFSKKVGLDFREPALIASLNRMFPMMFKECKDKDILSYACGGMHMYCMAFTLLTLLTAPRKLVEHTERPREAALYNGKRRVFHGYKDVSFRLTTHKSLTQALGMHTARKHASPCYHSVIGHWAHYEIDHGCEHDWQPVPLREGKHICPKCKGFRVWRNSHHRGDTNKALAKIMPETRVYRVKV